MKKLVYIFSIIAATLTCAVGVLFATLYYPASSDTPGNINAPDEISLTVDESYYDDSNEELTATPTIYWKRVDTELILSSTAFEDLSDATANGNFLSTKTTPLSGQASYVTSVKFANEVIPSTMYRWFYNFTKLTSVDFTNLNSSLATSMYQMFNGCTSLEQVDVSSLNTKNVTTFESMFFGCTKLKNVVFANNGKSRFANTQKVTTMATMFSGCTVLESAELKYFKNTALDTMVSMFLNCRNLTSVNMLGFKTDAVTSFASMFSGCSVLKNTNFKGFNTSNATSFSSMFNGCLEIETLDLSNFTSTKVTTFNSMFEGCNKLKVLNLQNITVSGDPTMQYMLRNAYCLEEITITKSLAAKMDKVSVNTNPMPSSGTPWYKKDDYSVQVIGAAGFVERSSSMGSAAETYFSPYTNKIYYAVFNDGTLKLSDVDFVDETNILRDGNDKARKDSFYGARYYAYSDDVSAQSGIFSTLSSLITKVVFEPSNPNVKIKPAHLSYWFKSLTNLTNVDLTGLDTTWALDAREMFYGCANLTTITNLCNLNTGRITTLNGMFMGCAALEDVSFNGGGSFLDTSAVTSLKTMFKSCTSLKTVDLSGLNFNNVKSMESMFEACGNLVSANFNDTPASQLTTLANMFLNCSSLQTVDLSSFNTANVTTLSQLFRGCASLNNPIIPFNTQNVTTFNHLVNGCTNLERLDLTSFTISSDATVSSMLANLDNVKELGVSKSVAAIMSSTALPVTAGSPWYKKDDHSISVDGQAGFVARSAAMANNAKEFYINPYTVKIYFAVSSDGVLTISDSEIPAEFIGLNDSGAEQKSNFLSRTVPTASPFVSYKTAITSARFLPTNENNPISLAHLKFFFNGLTNLTTVDFTGLDTTWALDAQALFKDCTSLSTIIGLNTLNFARVTTVKEMFYNCNALQSVDLSGLNTSNVTDMSYMFYFGSEVSNLKSINFTGIDTSKVELFNYMFHNCNSLESLDVTMFNTKSATTMERMFYHCKALKTLNLSSFETPNATTFARMFDSCISLTDLNISNMTSPMVDTFTYMFSSCSKLDSLDISNFVISNSAALTSMLATLTNLTEITLGKTTATRIVDTSFSAVSSTSPWYKKDDYNVSVNSKDTIAAYGATMKASDKVTFFNPYTLNIYWGVSGDGVLTISDGELNGELTSVGSGSFLGNAKKNPKGDATSSTTTYSYFSAYVNQIKSIVVKPSREDKKVTPAYLNAWFKSLTEVETIDLTGLDTAWVQGFDSTFHGCTKLKQIIGLESLDTSSATSMYYTFRNCQNLVSVDITNFNTSNVTDFRGMFYDCTSLQKIDLSSFTIDSSVTATYLYRMIYNCQSLKELVINKTGAKLVSSSSATGSDYENLNHVKAAAPIYLKDDDSTSFTTGIEASNYAVSFYSNSGNASELLTFVSPYSAKIYFAETEPGTLTISDSELGADQNSIYGTNSQSSSPFAAFKTVTKVVITGNVVPASTGYWFYEFKDVTSYDLSGLDTQWALRTSFMFYNNPSLKSIDVSNLNTGRVTNFESMFSTTGLTSLNLANFNTASATNMKSMFSYSSALVELNVSNFNTANVTTLYRMFYHCEALEALDLSSFNTTAVTDFDGVAAYCYALKTLDVSTFTFESVATRASMFVNLNSLRDLKINSAISSLFTAGTINFSGNIPSVVNPWYYVPDEYASLEYSKISSQNLKNYEVNSIAATSSYDGMNKAGRYVNFTTPYIYWHIKDGKLVLSDTRIYPDAATVNGVVPEVPAGNIAGKTQYASAGDVPWYAYKSIITSLSISGTVAPACASYYFSGLSNLTTADLTGFSVLNTDLMSYMFKDCTKLKNVNALSLDVSYVTNFTCMFYGCSSLEYLDLSTWTPISGQNFSSMFYNCAMLETLKLDSFATSSATTFASMFYNCASLVSVDLTKLDSTNVTTMASMFYGCSLLENVDFTNFNVENCTAFNSMFYNCISIKELDLSSFVTTSSTTFNSMFRNCEKLEKLNVKNFSFASSPTFSSMFAATYVLRDFYISDDLANKFAGNSYGSFDETTAPSNTQPWYLIDAAQVDKPMGEIDYSNLTEITLLKDMYALNGTTKIGGRFVTPLSLKLYWAINNGELILSDSDVLTGTPNGSFNIKTTTTSSSPWASYSASITSVSIEGNLTPGYMAYWFSGLTNLVTADLTGLNTSFCRSMQYLFYGCTNLQSVNANSLNVSSATNMAYMFSGCNKLVSLDLSSWQPKNVTNVSYMFNGMTALETVKLDKFATPLATNMSYMFNKCGSLKQVDLSSFNTQLVSTFNYMFSECSSLEELDASSINLASATNIRNMFATCKKLKTITFGDNFKGDNITNAIALLSGDIALTSVDLSMFSAPGITTNYSSMFSGLNALNEIKLSDDLVALVAKDTSYRLGLSTLITSTLPWYERDVMVNPERITNAKDLKSNTWYYNPSTAEIYWYVVDKKLYISSFIPEDIEYSAFLGKDTFTSGNLPWDAYKSIVTDVQFIGIISPISTAYWFENFTALVDVEFGGLVTDNTTNISYMFNNCKKLSYLDFSGLNMNSVKTFSYFLSGTTNLNSIVINEWAVKKKMANLGFAVNVPMYNETLDKEITKAAEMTVAGAYLGGNKVTFSDGKKWTKVVTPGRGNKVDLSTIDFTSIPIPEADEENHIVYIALDGWVDEDGNPVNFNDITSNITVYATFSYIKVFAPTTNLTYDKQSHDIVLENVFNHDCNIVYYYSTTETGIFEVAANTINAGYYYATITVNDRTTISEVYHVEPIEITVDGIVANNKQFDQTTTATFDATSATANGLLNGDSVTLDVTGSFVTANVGNNVAVNVTEIETNNVNYVVTTLPTGLTANINEKDIEDGIEVTGVVDKTYTGNEITQNFVVTVDGKRLTSGTDYTYIYKDNVNAGTATIEISGTGNYTGIKSVNFTINKKNIVDGDVSITVNPATYTGEAITDLNVTITYAGNTLAETDYQITAINNNVNAGGSATVTIAGAGNNFEGTKTVSFRINALSLLDCEVAFNDLEETYQYSGNTISPEFTLVANGRELTKNTDYTVFYLNNTKPGFATIRVTGRGNYAGVITQQFSIVSKDFTDCTVEFEFEELVYNGTSQKQVPTILDKDGQAVASTNYTYSYSTDTTNAGTVTVTITGANEYIYASTSATYLIMPKDISGEASVADIDDQTYNRDQQKPSAQVTLNGTTLVAGTDYTAEYEDNVNVGTAIVTINGTGNYKGSVATTFEIVQAGITNVTLQAKQVYFNGTQQMPNVLNVKAGNFNLKEDEYSVTYLNEDDTAYTGNFVDAAVIKVSVTALDTVNYQGSTEVTYTIRPAILSTLSLQNTKFEFDNQPHEPVVLKVSASNGYVLSVAEYTIEGFRYVDGRYETTATTDFTSAGRIKIVATGKNDNFTSNASQVLEISALSLQSTAVTIKYYFVADDGEGNLVPVLGEDGSKQYMEEDQVMPGQLILPEIVYALNETTNYTLVKDVDFTFTQQTLSGNENGTFKGIGRYKNVVEGKGNFSGKVESTYKINPRPFSPEYIKVTQNKASFEYTGGGIEYDFNSNDILVQDIFDSENPVTLTLGNHFELCNNQVTLTYDDGTEVTLNPVNGYINNVDAGTAILVLTGKDGKYSNDIIVINFEITGRNVSNCQIDDIDDLTFNGNYQRPTLNVKVPINDTEFYTLQEDVDYTLSFKDNFNAGLATVIITGANNFSGVVEKTFTINPKNIEDSDVVISGLDNVVYNTKDQQPNLIITHKLAGGDDITMLESDDEIDRDYAVIYSTYDFVNPSKITVYIFGVGNYTGALEKYYTIERLAITNVDVYDKVYSQQYSGVAYDLISKIVVSYEITETDESGNTETVVGTVNPNDYTLYYQVFDDNGILGEKQELNSLVSIIDAGVIRVTVEAKESSVYKLGTNNTYFDFEITAFSLTSENVEDVASVVFTGSEITVDPVVTFNGKVLRKNADYTVTYSNNVNVGEATVIIKGKGSYKGTATKTFEITPKDIGFADIQIINDELTYNGTNLELTGSDVVLTLDGITLVCDQDFVFEYEDDIRIATGVYNFNAKGINNYEGITIHYEFSVVPRDLSTLDFSNVPSVEYTGELLTPTFVLTDNFGNTTLNLNSDVVLTYGDEITNVNVAYKVENGEWVIDKQGIIYVSAGTSGNYTGSTIIYFAITPVDLAGSKITVSPITGLNVLLGEPIRPIPTVKFNNGTEEVTLNPALFDYTYLNNTVPGTATATVNAYPRTNFTGSASVEFIITDPNARPDLKDAVIENKFADVTYTGLDQTPDFSALEVYMDGEKLTYGEDYLIEYSKAPDYFVSVGKKDINVVAVKNGNYKGNQKFSFNVLGIDDTVVVYLYNTLVGDADEVSEWTYKELDVSNLDIKLEVESGRAARVDLYKVNNDGIEEFLEEIPENAGNYYIKVSLRASGNYKAVEVTYHFTVKPREITFSGIKAENKVYDGKLDAVINLDGLTFNGVLNGDEIGLTADLLFADANVGSDKIVYITNVGFIGLSAGNYTLAETGYQQTTKASITKISITANVVMSSSSVTYGTDPEVSFEIEDYQGDITNVFRLAFTNEAGETIYEVPTAAGVYTVVLEFIDPNMESNYQITGTTTKTLTINKVTLTAAMVQTIEDQDYTGSAIEPSVNVVNNGTLLVEGVDYTKEITNNTAVGTASIKLTGMGNYSGEITITFKIVMPPEEITDLTIENWVYGATNIPTPTYKAPAFVTVEIWYSTTADPEGEYSQEVPTEAGVYFVKAFITGKEADTMVTYRFKILPKTLSVTIGVNDYSYYETVNDPTITLSGVVGDDEVNVVVTYVCDELGYNSTEKPTDVGTYTVVVTITNTNYSLTENNTATFTISAVTADVTIEIESWIYGDTASTPSVEFKVDGEVVNITNYKVVYSTEADGEYSETVPTNVGTYYAKVTVENSNNQTFNSEITSFEITPRTITIKELSVKNKVYDGTKDAEIIVTKFTGIVAGDDLVITAIGSFESKNAKNNRLANVSEFILSGASAGNYVLATTGNVTFGKANITPKAITVTITAQDGTYPNIEDVVYSLTGGIEADGEIIVLVFTDSEGNVYYEMPTKAGTYTVSVELLYSNYVLAEDVSETFTISAAEISDVVVNGYTGTYDGAEHNAVVDSSETVTEGSVATWTFSLDEGGGKVYGDMPVLKNAGTYTVYFKITAENHEDYYGEFTVEIEKAELTVTVSNKNIVAGDPEPDEYKYSVTGLVEGEEFADVVPDFEIECGYDTTADIGDKFNIIATGTANGNYNLTIKNGVLTVVEEITNITLVEGSKLNFSVVNENNILEAIDRADYDDEETTIYLTGLSDQTTWGDLLEQLENNDIITAKDINGNELTAGSLVGTGTVITNGIDSVTVVVIGDLNGDGKLNMSDKTVLQTILEKVYTPNAEVMLAADINKDGRVNMSDKTIMQTHLEKIINIYESDAA